MTVVLEADGLGRSFGRHEVLKAASFRAHAGSVMVLLGRNGAGKTTMFRIAVGRLRADYGRVLYRGRYRAHPRLPRLAREGLFYSPQRTALTAHFTVQEHLTSLVRTYGSARLDEAIAALRLEEFLTRRSSRLSGGERQRAAMAMAWIRRPHCLLADEPFVGLAPTDRTLVAGALGRLREFGTAIVLTGHDVDDLLAVADGVTWVVAGTSHELGGPDQARQHEQFRREYLGPNRSP